MAAKALQEPRQERQPELPNHYEGRARSRRQADNSTRTSLALRPACSGRPSIGKGRTLTILLRHMWREMFVASLAYITSQTSVVWFVLRLISAGKCLIMPPISLKYGRYRGSVRMNWVYVHTFRRLGCIKSSELVSMTIRGGENEFMGTRAESQMRRTPHAAHITIPARHVGHEFPDCRCRGPFLDIQSR